MTENSDWLPALIRLEDFGGDWRLYIEHIYSVFHRDFLKSQPVHDSKWVRCRRDPIFDGKEAGFWHCTSSGSDEQNREPDFRRCERIAWVRAVKDHSTDDRVDVWRARRQRDRRVYLWLDESFLVVLGIRKRYYQLITAFCTEWEHTKRKLRKERDSQGR